ncbi:hypothetical protein [Enterobacter ludwigii]|uniref:hypothetical protein n=1 Tax=Enterobacter ludwigii TaxID=299767 RepID=UPI000643AD04|nr:hypothetical protein [Enterobacter ludwigii]KLP38076.1 hypothetical protein ABR36_11800 [Enterobacter ludwigii]
MKVRVVQAFADYRVGDTLSDEKVIELILSSERAHFVRLLPEQPEQPEQKPVTAKTPHKNSR